MRYALTIVSDESLAEDLVQQALERALTRLHTFRGDASLATWLHRILHSVAVDHFRRAREVPVGDFPTFVEQCWRDNAYTVDAAVVTNRAETIGELRDALLRLPVAYRTAVVLHDLEGMTVPAVADIQGVSLAAAKQRVRRGRMMLVSALAHGTERRLARAGVPLDCWSARAMVSDYLDDILASHDRLMVQRHVEKCPTCPDLYAAMVTSTSAIAHLRDADSVVPEDIAGRLRQVVNDHRQPVD